jgi:hypothetical protein
MPIKNINVSAFSRGLYEMKTKEADQMLEKALICWLRSYCRK